MGMAFRKNLFEKLKPCWKVFMSLSTSSSTFKSLRSRLPPSQLNAALGLYAALGDFSFRAFVFMMTTTGTGASLT